MEKKQEKKKIRRRRQVMIRRISLLVELAIVLASTIGVPVIQNITDIPLIQWQNSIWYYLFMLLFIGVSFGILWRWGETAEKTDIEELQDSVDKHFGVLAGHIDKLIEEIRQDRKYRRG